MQYLVFFGAFVNFLGSVYYLKETIQGKNKPNRVSFFLWGTVPLIGVAASLSDGVGLAVVPVLFAGLTPLMIFFASFFNRKSYWQLQRFDYACGGASILALTLWAITRDPNIAILFALIADGFAAIPTIKKAWTHPDSETAASYAGGLFGQFTVIFALETFAFSEIAFPIYLACANTVILFSIYHKKIL